MTAKFSIVLSVQPASFRAATFKGELAINLRRIARLGYAGVELAVRDPSLVGLDRLHEMISQHGLAVPAIGTGQAWGEEGLSFTDPDAQVRRLAIDRIKSHVPFASRFDAVIIIGLIRGLVRPGVDHARAMDWLIDALRECSSVALSSGVRLALEPINRSETTLINTVADGLELIDRVGQANFGLLLDTYHMHLEEPSIEAGIRACGSRLFHVHFADSNRRYPGAGSLDFASILGALASTGYAGWISGEFLPQPDAVTAAGRSLAFLKRLQPESPSVSPTPTQTR